MKKNPKDQTAHQQILSALANKRLPVLFVVPHDLFEQFCAEMQESGHAQTVWGRPVQAGDVTSVVLVYDAPQKKWWQFWK